MQNKNRPHMNNKSKQELLGYQSHTIQKNLTYFKPTKTSTTTTFADEIGKTVRGVKTMLTRRGLTCADYDGAARKEKASS